MVDKLISSYRAKIYDLSIKQWWALLKKNWKLIIAPIIFLIIAIGLYWFGAVRKSVGIMLISLFVEVIPLIYFDRSMVKYHALFLQSRQNWLTETKAFLREIVPDTDLYQEEVIDELIGRLSERIAQKVPFRNIWGGIKNFAKAIILPTATYIAGVYSGDLKEIAIEVVIAYAVFGIMLLSVLCFAWAGLSDIARIIFCRDYDAAVAFREDLLDLRLLYFRFSDCSKKEH